MTCQRLHQLPADQFGALIKFGQASKSANRGQNPTMTFTIELACLPPLLAAGVKLEQIATVFRVAIRTCAVLAADRVLENGLEGRPLIVPPQFIELDPEGGIYSEKILFDLS